MRAFESVQPAITKMHPESTVAVESKLSVPVATGAPSAVSCVAVQVLNIAYKHLAVFLTDRENWRTEVEYERQLVVKMSAFQLVNSFGALCASPC